MAHHLVEPSSIDRLSGLLQRFRVSAKLLHSGALCGITHFPGDVGCGYLHVLREGATTVVHQPRLGAPVQVRLDRPALLFYPKPLAHEFHNHADDTALFTCATVAFEGGARHPLARSLPAMVVVPLDEAPSLDMALTLLFAETDHVQCGQRLLADRLFEVVLLQMLRWMLNEGKQVGVQAGLFRGLAHASLSKVLVAVHDMPGEAWSLERMAAIAGMSRSAFAVTFKEVVGETPADYVTRWRLSIAQAALREGKPVKAIAADLGYASASALSRVFAQKQGVSPREWLAQQQPV